jgi:hypothetical protein
MGNNRIIIMAKKSEAVQQDLFPEPAEIYGLGVSEFKIKEGAVIAILNGGVTFTDVAQVTHEVWRKAIAEWLVALCGNNGDSISGYVDEARARLHRLEEERAEALALSANSKVSQFPSKAAGALA